MSSRTELRSLEGYSARHCASSRNFPSVFFPDSDPDLGKLPYKFHGQGLYHPPGVPDSDPDPGRPPYLFYGDGPYHPPNPGTDDPTLPPITERDIPIVVVDENDRPVPNLPPTAVKLWENGRPVPIKVILPDPTIPQLSFILDGSSSMNWKVSKSSDQKRLPLAEEIIDRTIRRFLGGPDSDKVAYAGSFDHSSFFHGKISGEARPGSDPEHVLANVKRIKSGTGSTPLFDAIGKAMEASIAAGKKTHTTLIVLSDGGNDSSHTYGPFTLAELAEASNTSVYFVDLGRVFDHIGYLAPFMIPVHLATLRPDRILDDVLSVFRGMRIVASETGGAYLHVAKDDRDAAEKAATALVERIQAQSALRFASDGKAHAASDYVFEVDKKVCPGCKVKVLGPAVEKK